MDLWVTTICHMTKVADSLNHLVTPEVFQFSYDDTLINVQDELSCTNVTS